MSLKAQPWAVHQTLDHKQDSFRLVEIEPGRPGQPVQCKLSNRSMSPVVPEYSALSYTWGERIEECWIKMNDKPFHVQSNLFHALQAIRLQTGTRVMWIDALCIDQSNLLERNHQIALMGEIYQNASSVFIWLGPGDEFSDTIFELLIKAKNGDVQSRSIVSELRSESQGYKGDDPLVANARRAWKSVSQRRYWRRTWIRQEVLLSRNRFVFCGSYSVAWKEFAQLVTTLENHIPKEDRALVEIVEHERRHINPRHMNLAQLIFNYAHYECSDRKDRIFSLLSLAYDCSGKDKFTADYALNEHHLFFAVMAFCRSNTDYELAEEMQEALDIMRLELVAIVADNPNSEANIAFKRADNTSAEVRRAQKYVEELRKHRANFDPMRTDLAAMTPLGQRLIVSLITDAPLREPRLITHLYQIERTDLALGFKKSIFGPHLVAIIYRNAATLGRWRIYHRDEDACSDSESAEESKCTEYGFRILYLRITKQILDVEHLNKIAAEESCVPSLKVLGNVLNNLMGEVPLCRILCDFLITGVYGRKLNLIDDHVV